MASVVRPIRIRKDLDTWFNETFPWHGSLPQFVNKALEEFQRQWGDRPSPHKTMGEAVSRVIREGY